MSEIETQKNTIYWTYRIDDMFWDQLERNFYKKTFRISSFKVNAVRKGDIILIFKTHKTASKNGFVAVCQVDSDMQYNEEKVKIFNDMNMNKFYCELSSIFILDNVLQLTSFKNYIPNFNAGSFRKMNIGENTMLVKMNTSLANEIVPVITECMPEVESKIESQSDSQSQSQSEHDSKVITKTKSKVKSKSTKLTQSENYDCRESDVDESNVGDNDELGHFPVLFEPCDDFIWNDINSFRHHFTDCPNCNQTDNNEISVSSKLKSKKIYFEDLKTEKQISVLSDCYHNTTRYKPKNNITIHKINNENVFLDGCCFITW